MIVNFEGVKAIVRKANFTVLGVAMVAISAFVLSGCEAGAGSNSPGGVKSNEAAATVNGKAIKLEEIERLLKQQAQGQEARLSTLELAQARLQILGNLIQDEVLYQKAEKEQTVPTDDEVTTEYNRLKTGSGKSQDQWTKDLTAANETEESLRDKVKRQLAVKKLEDKITGKVEPPKDSEIDAFYAGNKEFFVKKKGVKLAAIVVDPSDGGEGDTTKTDADAVRVTQEIIGQLRQNPDTFTQIAREKSEDQSRLQGGELGYIAEDQLRDSFPSETVAALMSPQFAVGGLTATRAQGRYFILKLQERSDKDENLTLESPGIREQVTKTLTDARKQLLVQAYAAVAMNEAKIVNHLAEKVISSPNELSGARPVSANTPAVNANAPANAPANTNANTAANTNSAKPAANAPAANAKK
jgi:hypothetical protein